MATTTNGRGTWTTHRWPQPDRCTTETSEGGEKKQGVGGERRRGNERGRKERKGGWVERNIAMNIAHSL